MIEIETPEHDEWYWVSFEEDGSNYFPAAWDNSLKNWHNYDTWEDFDHKIIWWKKIELPEVQFQQTVKSLILVKQAQYTRDKLEDKYES